MSARRGDSGFKPEQLTAYESGARVQPRTNVSLMGRELLHSRHAEFAGNSAQLRYFQREVALRVTFSTR
jgi:hypothetical protein